MTIPPQPASSSAALRRSVSAMLDWWGEAGVDYSFRDTPQPWLHDPQERVDGEIAASADKAMEAAAAKLGPRNEARVPSNALPLLGGDRASWPADLASFGQWWLTEESLGEPGAFPRIAPAGEAGAAIMLIVPEPEEADRDRLLSGPNGATARLLLRAMGIAPASAYFASVLPRHTPLADWSGLAARGLGDIVRHHIALAAPQHVVALGRPIARLFGKDEAVFCAPGLDELQRSAQRRQRFWRSWLEWTEGSWG